MCSRRNHCPVALVSLAGNTRQVRRAMTCSPSSVCCNAKSNQSPAVEWLRQRRKAVCGARGRIPGPRKRQRSRVVRPSRRGGRGSGAMGLSAMPWRLLFLKRARSLFPRFWLCCVLIPLLCSQNPLIACLKNCRPLPCLVLTSEAKNWYTIAIPSCSMRRMCSIGEVNYVVDIQTVIERLSGSR